MHAGQLPAFVLTPSVAWPTGQARSVVSGALGISSGLLGLATHRYGSSLLALLLLVAEAGCAHEPAVMLSGAEVEVALDEGRASERPLTPPKTFEMLMRIDPKMPSFQAVAMRFLLAQPGRIVFTIYATGADGRPGETLKEIDRDYGPWLLSSANDGKWVIERLVDVPVQHAPIFIGISSPEKHSDPRLWASSNNSGQVFQREADPSTPLESTRIPRTPKLRVSVAPAL